MNQRTLKTAVICEIKSGKSWHQHPREPVRLVPDATTHEYIYSVSAKQQMCLTFKV